MNPNEIIVTKIPAIITPEAIAVNDFQRFRPSSHAIRLPVQAPVTGRGIATNKAKARNPMLFMSFWTFSAFFLARSIKTLLNLRYHFQAKNLECKKSRNKKIGNMTKILTIVHAIKASDGERPDAIAKGIPPLNSIKGNMLKIIAKIGSITGNRINVIKTLLKRKWRYLPKNL